LIEVYRKICPRADGLLFLDHGLCTILAILRGIIIFVEVFLQTPENGWYSLLSMKNFKVEFLLKYFYKACIANSM